MNMLCLHRCNLHRCNLHQVSLFLEGPTLRHLGLMRWHLQRLHNCRQAHTVSQKQERVMSGATSPPNRPPWQQQQQQQLQQQHHQFQHL